MTHPWNETSATVELPATGVPRTGPSGISSAAAAVVLGVLLGVCSRFLPGTPLNPVVDTVAFWALCGFAAGAVAVRPRAAVVAAVATETIALAVWYGHNWLTTSNFDWAGAAPRALVWGAGALVAGVVFGLAGSWWRTYAPSPRRELAAALPVAVELWAAAYAAVVLRYTAEAVWSVAIAVLLLVALPRSRRDRMLTAATAVPITLVGVLAGAVFVTVVYRVV